MIVRYSIIRFMPFAETQEFANVGVLAHSPDAGTVEFKLAAGRNKRISAFFDDMDGFLYTKAMGVFKAELTRVKNVSVGLVGRALANFMDEVTRPREGFLTYSDTSTMLTNDDLGTVVERLYETYVARSFVTKEHKEAVLLRMVKQDVNRVSGRLFRKDTLGSGALEFELPLVAKTNEFTKAIKPLAFFQNDPLALFDHGQTWIQRVNYLLSIDALEPNNFLFVVETPTQMRGELQEAYSLVTKEMKNLDVRICDFDQKIDIAKFARVQNGVHLNDFSYQH